MVFSILLIIDIVMLAIVVTVYSISSYRERRLLRQEANQALELQQKVYQAQVLKEINERIGYSLDKDKVVEIITNSLGNLLHYDTVSYVLLEDGGKIVFKCHVENTVNHLFIDQVKDRMLVALSAILSKDASTMHLDESITGNILDDSLQVKLRSYFNLPVFIMGKLVGIINVASTEEGKYNSSEAAIFYTITNQASTAVSKLQTVLESEKGKLAAILYSMADGVIMVDSENRLMLYNPAVGKMLGLNPAKEITMFDIVDALAGKIDLRTKIEQALQEDKAIELDEVTLKDKAFEMTLTPVKDASGQQLGATVVFHDITTEKTLEKTRQEFTAMMVHELRAPLTAVRWSSESLIKNLSATTGVEPAKLKDTVVTIETASNNMLELVNDLLDVAKIEAGKFELNLQDYNIMEVVKEQAKAFQPQAEVKHLPISVNGPDKYTLKFDRVRISQVLGNLLSNAIKYTDSGQIDILITADNQEKVLKVGVKDSGMGVPREDLNVLFSKFKQLRGADRARKGTGLGLVVCKGIIEAHGGKMSVESPGEGLGSTFYFSLPLESQNP